MKRIFISTTQVIENAEILEYKGVVSSCIVTGAGFFSDLAASFTDFFGGRSGSYQNQMDMIYQEALDDLSKKATKNGANAIIALHLDFDNISGKGMSMFMVNVIGTAVKVAFNKEQADDGHNYIIPAQRLEQELKKRYFLSLFSKGGVLSSDELEEINKNALDDYSEAYSNYVKRILRVVGMISYEASNVIEHFKGYLSSISRDSAISAVYPLVEESLFPAKKVIIENKLFDAQSIESLVDKGLFDIACGLLISAKPTYSANDLPSMKALSEKLHNLPDKGSISFVKGGVFSKDADKYICPEGHTNNKEVKFCEKCGLNIKGLTEENILNLKKFDETIEALEYLLKN